MEIDGLLEAVKDFERKGKKEESPVLDQFLCHIAKTGEARFQWLQFKSYFVFKLEKVMDDFRASAPEPRDTGNPNIEFTPYEEMKARILKIVDGFNGIPFTIQRLCELLTDPKRNYSGTDKFLRGVEKNVMVVSCLYPSSEKNSSNSLNRMNGVMFPSNSPVYSDRSNINGPGTPRPLNRPKSTFSSSLATNGLPDSTENKELNLQEELHSESPVSEAESTQSTNMKNKHSEDDIVESEGHEVKRLKFDRGGGSEEDETTTLKPSSSESSLEMSEACENSSESMDGDDDSRKCMAQSLSEEEEPSSTQVETPSLKRKDVSEAATAHIEKSDDHTQMDQSDKSHLEKDLHSETNTINEDGDFVTSSGVDSSETEELGSCTSGMPQVPQEICMENSDDATEEPMEQD